MSSTIEDSSFEIESEWKSDGLSVDLVWSIWSEESYFRSDCSNRKLAGGPVNLGQLTCHNIPSAIGAPHERGKMGK